MRIVMAAVDPATKKRHNHLRGPHPASTDPILATVNPDHAGCPLCGSTRYERTRLYAAHHLARCLDCGFRFSARVPTDAELNELYGSYAMIRDLSPVTAKRYDDLLDHFEPYRRSGILCEVGAGGGLFLDRARMRGWQCRGTEFDPAIVEECKARGLEMHCGPVTGHPWERGTADVVVSIEVIEHLRHPMTDLRCMVELLRPGGLLYVTMPNFNSVSKWLNHGTWTIVNYPEHISFFTPRTLHRALASLGLQRISLRTTGISLNRLRRSHGRSELTTAGISKDEQVRRTIEGSAGLRFAKASVDAVLDFTGKGDTLKAFYVKPINGDTGSL